MPSAHILTEPALAAVRALNADRTASTYLAIAISAVQARDEEVRAAIRHMIACPALDQEGSPEVLREAFRTVGRLLYGPAWAEE